MLLIIKSQHKTGACPRSEIDNEAISQRDKWSQNWNIRNEI